MELKTKIIYACYNCDFAFADGIKQGFYTTATTDIIVTCPKCNQNRFKECEVYDQPQLNQNGKYNAVGKVKNIKIINCIED